jgi:hypothetical protein
MWLLTAILPFAGKIRNDDAVGYARLAGTYSGLMSFHDKSDNQDHSFGIDLVITASPDGTFSTWNWKYNYSPPRFAAETATYRALSSGTEWQEKSGTDDFRFALRHWDDFCRGKTSGFEIQRVVKKGMIGGENVDFLRRYRIVDGSFVSEKWIRYPGKGWEFSHLMQLRRQK